MDFHPVDTQQAGRSHRELFRLWIAALLGCGVLLSILVLVWVPFTPKLRYYYRYIEHDRPPLCEFYQMIMGRWVLLSVAFDSDGNWEVDSEIWFSRSLGKRRTITKSLPDAAREMLLPFAEFKKQLLADASNDGHAATVLVEPENVSVNNGWCFDTHEYKEAIRAAMDTAPESVHQLR